MITRQTAIERGTFSPDINAGIYDKWFTRPPSHFLGYAIKRYGLGSRSVIDVGSAFGHALPHFGAGSYGVEMNPSCAAWANAVGLTTVCGDMESIDVEPVSAVWCRDVLEHADSPHLILRRLWWALEDNGQAFLALPLTNLGRHLGRLSNHFRGYAAADHVNFFTTPTLHHTIERAGFKVEAITAAAPIPLWLAPACLAVARKVRPWNYPKKATRMTDGRKTRRKDQALHAL